MNGTKNHIPSMRLGFAEVAVVPPLAS